MPTNKELEQQIGELKQLVADMAGTVNSLLSAKREAPAADEQELEHGDAELAELISKNQAEPGNQSIIAALEKLAASSESRLFKRSAKPLQVEQKFTPENYSLKRATYELARKNGWEVVRNSWAAIEGEQFAYECYVTSPFHKGRMHVVSRWKYDEALDYWTPVIGLSPNAPQHIQNPAHRGSKKLNLRPGQRAHALSAAKARAMREGDLDDEAGDPDEFGDVDVSSYSADE